MAAVRWLPVASDSFRGSARMFSFLGDLFVLLLSCVWGRLQQVVNGLDRAVDSSIGLFYDWLHGTDQSSQHAIAARLSVGPPSDLWSWLRSLVRPTPLARVRVPARRSIR